MEPYRAMTTEERASIPGLHLLTHVRGFRSEPTAAGSRNTVEGLVRVPSDAPIMRGRTELSHVAFVEAANNVSHWITGQVPELADVRFRVPTVFPRGMGLPPLRADTDIPVRGEVCFEKVDRRWRGEVEVRFYREDGSRAETVSFPLVVRRTAG